MGHQKWDCVDRLGRERDEGNNGSLGVIAATGPDRESSSEARKASVPLRRHKYDVGNDRTVDAKR